MDINEYIFITTIEKKCKKKIINKMIKQLKLLQKNSIVINIDDYKSKISNFKFNEDHENEKFYLISNIIWSDNLVNKMKKKDIFIEKYFYKMLKNLFFVDKILVNPPIICTFKKFKNIKYIHFPHNHLTIIDALFDKGSNPIYLSKQDNKLKFIYSEFSGAINIDHDRNKIAEILIATNKRISSSDKNIFLPKNNDKNYEYEFFFHTHPNTIYPANRINHGILYEFPSVNDLFNYTYFRKNGKMQASIVFAQEGIYNIRPIDFENDSVIDNSAVTILTNFLVILERLAIKKYSELENIINNVDVFNKYISNDRNFIDLYNYYIKQYNLFIEFYPRIKINNQWHMPAITLPFIK